MSTKVTVQGLADVQPESPLDNGRYTLECVQVAIADREKGQSLRLNFVVKGGPTQSDGASPEDRRISDFIPLSGFSEMKDGGVFVKRKLREACDAFGVKVDDNGSFDYEDFMGATADVTTRKRETPEGLVEAQINRYIPSVEG